MRLSVFLLFLLFVFSSHAQNHLAKIGATDPSLPAWARLMYAENPNFYEVVAAYQQYYLDHPFQKNIHTQYFKRWVSSSKHRVQADGQLREETPEERAQHTSDILRLQGSAGGSRDLWHYEGPVHHVDGDGSMTAGFRHSNVYCHDRSASNTSLLYCGTESGGAYKSVDAGLHWEYVTENEQITTVSAIRIHPTNEDVVILSANNDLWRSVDGGQTWQVIGQPSFQSLNISAWEIAYWPGNANVVFAATNQGLFRSDDNGDTWSEVLPQNCETICFQPGNPNVVYTIQEETTVGFARFYKSTDGGLTFSLSVNGWFDASMGDIDIQGGRLATTEADPNRIYAVLIGYQNAGSTVTTNGWVGTWVSYDAGETWTFPHGLIGTPYTDMHPNLMNFQADDGDYSQIHYNTTLIASQLDPDKILIGGLNLWRSDDAAATYVGVGGYIGGIDYFHVDQQEYRIYKTGPTTEEIWFSNDGGIGHSADFMQTHENLNRGLYAVNLWGYDQGWNEDMMVGGRYHNGNMAYHENYPSGEFIALGGGEAATGYVKYTDENKALFSDIGGRVLPEALNMSAAYFGVGQSPNEHYWNNASSRILFDHEYYDIAWVGREHKLYRSTNGGGSFSEVHAFGTDPANELYWMEQSFADHDVMYVQQAMGGSSSKMWRTLDHGLTWNQIPLPNTMRYLCFTTSATNADELWVGYYDGSNGNKVYHTVDAGQNWENITTQTLDGQSVWAIAHQYGTDGGVYLAMLHGVVYYRNNAMTDWVTYSTGLPVSTEPLRIVPFIRDQVVRLATWNLGVWEAPCYEPSALIANFSAAYNTFFCPGDAVHFVNHSVCSANATFAWSFPGATPSTSTEPYPTVVYNQPGTYDVTLTVTDGGQSQTVTRTNYISNEEPLFGDFIEDFETGAIPSEWRADGNGAWTISSDASAFGNGTYSMRFDNYYYDAQGARDRIWLGKQGDAIQGLGLSFDVAYAQYSDGYSDTLAVVYSTDCGATWNEAWVLGGDDLSNAPDNTGYYIPAATEWASHAVDIIDNNGAIEFIIAFENRGRYGNVIYVDNVNILHSSSVDEPAKNSTHMILFPNPVSDFVQISARGLLPGMVGVEFFDAQGKLVHRSSVLVAGDCLEKRVQLPPLDAGLYTVVLRGSGNHLVQRMQLLQP